MDINFAISILEAVVRENLTETGDLVEIREECERDPKFAGALANACGYDNVGEMTTTINKGISDIRSHHARMERRERRRW